MTVRPEPLSLPRPQSRPTSRIAMVIIASGAAAFLVLQALLTVRNLDVWNEIIARAVATHPGSRLQLQNTPTDAVLALVALGGLLTLAVFGLAEMAIIMRGHRLLWIVPLIAYSFFGLAAGQDGPVAIGVPWVMECLRMCGTPWYWDGWIGPVADLLLVAVPGVVLSTKTRRVPVSTQLDRQAIAAVALSAALAVMVERTSTVLGQTLNVSSFVAAVCVGVLLGTGRPWWPWLHTAIAAVASGALGWLLTGGGAPAFPVSATNSDPIGVLLAAIPYVAGTILASAWEPLARLLRQSQAQPLWLLIVVNALNAADAIFTAVAVHAGGAIELNPLIRYAGLSFKVLLVGGLSWLLYRWRPGALVWPAVVLTWVVAYQFDGVIVNWR